MKSLNQLFFFCLWNLHIVKLKLLQTESIELTVNDTKEVVSGVQVYKMLATVS